MALFTLIKANMKYKKGSFISVFLLIFIIATTLITFISSNSNIETRVDESMDAVGIGDLVAISNEYKLTNEILSDVESNENVEKVETIKSLVTTIKIDDIEKNESVFLVTYDSAKHPYEVYNDDNTKFINNPDELSEGEMYVPLSFSSIYECKVGDVCEVVNGDKTNKFTIKGFIEEPFMGAEAMGFKSVYMSDEDFKQLYSEKMTEEEYNSTDADDKKLQAFELVNVYMKDDCKLSYAEFKKSVNKTSHLIDYSWATLGREQSKGYTLLIINIFSGILFAFSTLLFIIVLVIIAHSISSGIDLDYVNLGVLKTQGFTKNDLRRSLLVQYILAEILGLVAGLGVSMLTIPLVNKIYVSVTGLLPAHKIVFLQNAILLFGIILLSVIIILWKTKTIGEVSPVKAISGGKDSIYFSNRLNSKIGDKLLYIQLAFRQLISNGRQYISSSFIVGILVFFMISVTVLNNCINPDTVEEVFVGYACDISIDYELNPDLRDDVEADIKEICEIDRSFRKNNTYLTVDGDEYLAQITDGGDVYKNVIKGRNPRYDNEILITQFVADDLCKKIGDEVEITYQDKTAQFIIVGIFQSTNDVGKTFSITLDGVHRINDKYELNAVNYKLSDPNKSSEVVDKLNEKYKDQIFVQGEDGSFIETITMALDIIMYLTYAVAIIFTIVIVIMMCSRMFIKEKQDLGRYKAFGFTNFNLRLMFAIRFLIVALFGSTLGIIADFLLNNSIMNILLKNIGITKFSTRFSIGSVMIPATIITFSFFICSYLVAGKIKKIDTTTLMSEE